MEHGDVRQRRRGGKEREKRERLRSSGGHYCARNRSVFKRISVMWRQGPLRS